MRLLVLLLGLLAPQARPTVDYTLTANTTEGVYDVQMRIRNAPADFTLAAHAHPEYDDKYWRYIEDMRSEGGTIERLDSVRWRAHAQGADLTLKYRIRAPLAPPLRAAWKSFLTPTGGVAGGPHSFLYVVGHEDATASVQVVLPAGWSSASGMPRDQRGHYQARDIFTLMESPIMVGRLRHWSFDVDKKTHDVFYLPGSDPQPFDSAAFVDGIRRYVTATVDLFRQVPYDRYVFMFVDDAYGGLEHPNSVTLGLPSKDLAEDPHASMREIAHEFFHTWNLMRIKPIEYRRVDYRVQPPVAGLWFSEGLSIFYADLLRRRAGFVLPDTTRVRYLEGVLMRYANDPGYDKFSPEQISRTAYNSAPGALGNYSPSSHLIGEVLGTMLDLLVRDATDGGRSMDDVMRLLNDRHATRGFTGADIERAVADVCACNARPFFERHVRSSTRIDANTYLNALGLRASETTREMRTPNGEIERDFRIRAWQPAPSDTLRVMLWTPESIWARAGLNTNDRIVRVNGTAPATWPEFRALIAAAPLGSTVKFEIVRNGQPMTIDVVVSGYTRRFVQITEAAQPTERQLRLRKAWLSGR